MIVINAGLESTALDAHADLNFAIAFDFVNPNHLMDMAAFGHIAAAHQLPRAIAFVVAQFDSFAIDPVVIAGGIVHTHGVSVSVFGAPGESARKALWKVEKRE